MARHSLSRVDARTCGNPVRVAAGGGPILPRVPMGEPRVGAEARVGDRAAIEASVAGRAKVVGRDTIFVDDEDPLAHGFQRV